MRASAGRATRSGRGRESGFTLIEATVAAALLAFGLCGAVSAVAGMLGLTRESQEVALAAADLQSAVELIQGTPAGELETRHPNGAAIPRFEGLHLRDEHIVVSYPNPGVSPLEVRLTISWTERSGGTRSVTAASLLRTKY